MKTLSLAIIILITGKSIWVTFFSYQRKFIKAKVILKMAQTLKIFIIAIYGEVPTKD